jgi:hypothetical protein
LAAWGVLEEAAMPMDEAALAELRQANARYAADYERWFAVEIVAMIRNTGVNAQQVLRLIDAILKLPVGE